MKVLLFALGLGILFAGCAPKYVLQKHYITPKNMNFEKFSQECSSNRAICQDTCRANLDSCLSRAYDRAKNILVVSNKNYEKKYQRYLARMNDYNFNIIDWQSRYDKDYRDWQYFRDICRKKNDRYACDREDDLRYIVKNEIRNRPKEPKEPRSASFEEILSTQQKVCTQNCGCQEDFDICFTKNGGIIKSNKECIENCD
ncbi:MAG: hypothetical protein GXP61_08600 [Epsilonproteobacteria bacterium]|nr:hypothetical protein [Campylobacterota bacterium]